MYSYPLVMGEHSCLAAVYLLWLRPSSAVIPEPSEEKHDGEVLLRAEHANVSSYP